MEKRKWLATPYGIWMLLFTLVPLLFVVYYAFTAKDGSFSLENFRRLSQPLYLSSLLTSIKLAIYSTLICLLIGYPTAYFLAGRDFSERKMLVVLILLPMWMNFLLRTYAMMTILENNGLLNTLLEKLGLPKRQFIGTEGAVLLGLVYNYLPFMVLPIYTALKKIDNGMIEAAEELGANPLRVVTRVVIPQTVPGILSGITMVFMPAVTTFAISYMLSNGTIYLTGDMIDEFFRGLNNRNAGSALSLVMMLLMLGSTLLLRRANPNQKGGKA